MTALLRALVVFSLLLLVVNAHFLLYEPVSRGFDEDLEPQAPCGGFNTAGATRTTVYFGARSTDLSFEIQDDHGGVAVFYSSKANPNATDFVETTQVVNGVPGTVYKVPLKTNTVDNLSSGSFGTFQFIYESITTNDTAGQKFYQCADVVFQASSATRAIFDVLLIAALTFVLL